MRISHKYKYIFISVSKTGSTSVRNILKDYSDILSNDDKNSPYYHHTSSDKLKQYFQETAQCWDDYFKFTFVRNPYDRVVSWWNYIKSTYKAQQKGKPKNTTEEWQKFCAEVMTNHNNFKSFILARKLPRSASEFIFDKDENNLLDFIGKLENLQEDFDVVCDKIGIPPQQLPHVNKTKHKHYTEYYDDETREIVAEKYAKDIEYFGYEFGG